METLKKWSPPHQVTFQCPPREINRGLISGEVWYAIYCEKEIAVESWILVTNQSTIVKRCLNNISELKKSISVDPGAYLAQEISANQDLEPMLVWDVRDYLIHVLLNMQSKN